jgi:hypothetical protein
LITTYGPAVGSFFSDSFGPHGLKRYRWAKLPPDLENELQDILARGGYAKARIGFVGVNSANGWIVISRGGEMYSWGGKLPHELTEALEAGKRDGVRIEVLSLFHSHFGYRVF